MAKILIVEDDAKNLELLGWDMEDLGHAWQHAGNASDAERLSTEDEFDLVLMDITIPAMPGEPHNSQPHGLSASTEIRRRHPSLPIVAITAHGMQHMRQQVMKAGCNEILEKPFAFEQLRDTLHKWLQLDGQSPAAQESGASKE
ncbi:MAG: response regulator [Rubripirellula sp.]